jgi:hypothetical protein
MIPPNQGWGMDMTGGRFRAIAAMAGCALLYGGAVAFSAEAPPHPEAAASSMDDVSRAISSVKPNCRRIAARRLRAELDRGDLPYLTAESIDHAVGALRDGGSVLCDSITGQSFVLGGT